MVFLLSFTKGCIIWAHISLKKICILLKTIGEIYAEGRKYMIIKQKLYSPALVSAAIVLMLINIAGAAALVDNPNNRENCDVQTITYPFNVTNKLGNVSITEPIKVTDNKEELGI